MSYLSKFKSKSHSSYWLQDWDDDDTILDTLNDDERKSHDLYKLSAAKRAISNFVNIVTNQQIPVKFSTRGNSYTDGKEVVIGANVVEPKDFDIAVGLALHEGSHIKLSDFRLLQNIYSLVPTSIVDESIKKGVLDSITIIKNLWNYVEDRRIDRYVYDSAPGYREYYRSMYDKYFNDPMIDKGLESDEYTEESVDSYMFRIINLHNKNTDLSKLKGLKEIYKLVGLGSISRLKSSQDTFNVALELYKVILSNLPVTPPSDDENGNEQGQGESGDGDSQGNSSGESREMSDEEFEDFTNDLMGSSPMGGGLSDETPTGGSGMSVENLPDNFEASDSKSKSTKDSSVKLSDKQKELLKKKIQNQKKFLDGDVQKKNISKKEEDAVETLEESGSEMKTVGKDLQIRNMYGTSSFHKGIQCVVVNKLTTGLLNSDEFPLSSKGYWGDTSVRVVVESEVMRGIQIGTVLGKKLQVRGESRTTVYNRQKVGKIDKRLVSSLGFGNENVFSVLETDSYKKANLHVSIDASGSMAGSKWSQTITNVVALCKAVDMIQNLSIQVSFRTTTRKGLPYIVLAYDSRREKFSKVKEFFKYLTPNGTTPEGLTYEAILDKFIPAGNDFDSYFLNISDGEPFFELSGMSYYGSVAQLHTKKMMGMIEAMGIKTLSYFVSDSSRVSDALKSAFTTMYGKGASFIDVTNISQISKTMNQLFLKK
jgi:hypothetical protein